MVVPPPLCAYHLRLPTAVSQVTFGTGLQTNDIIVLTSDNQLMLFAHMDDKGAFIYFLTCVYVLLFSDIFIPL